MSRFSNITALTSLPNLNFVISSFQKTLFRTATCRNDLIASFLPVFSMSYIYIYIYIERERDRQTDRQTDIQTDIERDQNTKSRFVLVKWN